MNWFAKARQEWIGDTVRVFGYINREHIVKKFGVSTPQASMDLQAFMVANPGRIVYDKSMKRYFAFDGGGEHG